MTIPGFIIHGTPRTKKTSNRVISIPKSGSRRCNVCGHRPGFPKVMPSEAHEEWFKEAMDQAPDITRELASRGVELPIVGLVNVRALFYRDRAVGDLSGFIQALADYLQAARIIENDSQIESWDGSRRLKDPACPRIEVWIEVVQERAVTRELFGETSPK